MAKAAGKKRHKWRMENTGRWAIKCLKCGAESTMKDRKSTRPGYEHKTVSDRVWRLKGEKEWTVGDKLPGCTS